MPFRPALLHLAPTLLACSLPCGAVAWAAPGETPTPGADIHAAELAWPQGARLTVESTDYEVVVRFDRPLDEDRIKAFAESVKPDLADLRWNDASIVMVAAPGRRIEAVAAGSILRMRFLPDNRQAAAIAAAPDPEAETATDLAITSAQADAAAGYPHRARLKLMALARARPADQRVQRVLADAEAADGATALAAMRYRQIEAEDIGARRVIAESRGNVGAGVIIRDGTGFSQIEGIVTGAARVNPGVAVGFAVRHLRSEAESVAGPLGLLANAKSNSTIAELTASMRIENATRLELKGGVQLDKKIAGVGLQAFFGSPERQARVTLAYRLPDTSTQEQAIFGGHITRAGAGGSARLTTGLFVQGDVAWNGYGLERTPVRTKTISANASVEVLMRRKSPTLSVNYRLEGEYEQKTVRRPNGLAYIPIDDRENHTAQLVSSIYGKKVAITGAAGWTVDRYGGGDGPVANISATANLGRSWRIEGSGGVSSVSRPGVSGRYYYFRLFLTRNLG